MTDYDTSASEPPPDHEDFKAARQEGFKGLRKGLDKRRVASEPTLPGPFEGDYNEDGSLKCNLCWKDPCVCGQPKASGGYVTRAEAERMVREEREWLRTEVDCLAGCFISRDTRQDFLDALAAAIRARGNK